MRPNWFIGFPLDGSFLAELPAPPPRVRLFPSADVHVTVAFFGAVPEPAARGAFGALQHWLAAEPLAAIDISLAQVEPMGGSRRGYTALSALLGEGREEATAALVRLRDPLRREAGLQDERRSHVPHATLARPRRRASDEQRQAGLQWARSLQLDHVHQRLDRLALYTWSDQRPARLFQIVASLSLP